MPSSPERTTVFRNCDWIVAWDENERTHAYLSGADLAIRGDAIGFVGRGYDGPADEEIDVTVLPGGAACFR